MSGRHSATTLPYAPVDAETEIHRGVARDRRIAKGLHPGPRHRFPWPPPVPVMGGQLVIAVRPDVAALAEAFARLRDSGGLR